VQAGSSGDADLGAVQPTRQGARQSAFSRQDFLLPALRWV
jgi:hypothetical protein